MRYRDRTQSATADVGRKEWALVLLLQHPGWSNVRIAKAAGICARQLYRWPEFLRLRELLREGDRLLPGVKDPARGVEAAFPERDGESI